MGDQTQLVQVFQNLLGNAVKFRREESPRVRVWASPNDGCWQFAVEDNGIGIASDQFDNVFQAFRRVHGGKYPGTGIGLAICKKIVDRHAGRIWLDSVLGRGTTFYLTLPMPSPSSSAAPA
jgi:signal transduction histidine kinase